MAPAAQAGKYKRDKDTRTLNHLLSSRCPDRVQDLIIVREADVVCRQPVPHHMHYSSLFQALGQWGKWGQSKKRAQDERGLVKKWEAVGMRACKYCFKLRPLLKR